MRASLLPDTESTRLEKANVLQTRTAPPHNPLLRKEGERIHDAKPFAFGKREQQYFLPSEERFSERQPDRCFNPRNTGHNPFLALSTTVKLLFLLLCTVSLVLASVSSFADGSHTQHKKTGKKIVGKKSSSRKAVSASEARAARVRREQINRKLHAVSAHMHTVRGKIHASRVKENQIGEKMHVVEARLDTTRSSLTRVNHKLKSLEEEHDAIVQRLDETQERLTQRRIILGQRVRDSYQRGQVTYAQVLLNAGSVHEMLSRAVYVKQIVQSDARLIDGVQEDIRQIGTDKRALESQAKRQRALADEFESQKAQFAQDLNQKQELLKGVQAARAEAQDELDDLEGEAEAMTDRIRSLSQLLRRRQEAERQAELERRRALAARRTPHKTSGRKAAGRHKTDDEPSDTLPELPAPPVFHGSFIRPSGGPITSGFGYRYHPILHRRKLHTGVDFGAASGASIRAAAGGVVIMASYSRGYGNCVIIDHGDGVTTLYGHCSELLCSEGDTVSQGQTIARVGATGLATGPHLHFEVRHNGVPVSPLH